jgi:hypothetical protein
VDIQVDQSKREKVLIELVYTFKFVCFSRYVEIGFWTSTKIDFVYALTTLSFTVPAIIVLSYFYVKIKSLKEAEDDLDGGENPLYSRMERVIAKRVNYLYFLVVKKCYGMPISRRRCESQVNIYVQRSNMSTFGAGSTRIVL